MGSSSANLGPPTSSAAKLQPRIMKAVLFLTMAVTLSLMLDLSNSFWITRSRMGRNRFGRSDPDMVDDDAVEYEDNDLLDDLANAILDRQEKRSMASLIRNRDLRNLGALHGKRGMMMMNPMAKSKGLSK